MTNQKDELFLAELRNYYLKVNHAISISKAHQLGKNIFSNQKAIKWSLKRLKESNLIELDPMRMTVMPYIPEETEELMEKPKTTITEIKVRHVIRLLGKATPNAICKKYMEVYGIVNSESLTRFVRKLYEKGNLKRNEQNEYFMNEKMISKPLILYI